MKRIPLLLTLIVLASGAQAADTPQPKITYDDHILPILRDNCFACHGQDKQKAGLSLHNYTKLMQGSSSGAVVKPGDPSGSALYGVVAHTVEPFMPPKSPKLEKEAELLRKWIEGGALENMGSKAVVGKPNVEIGLKTVSRGKPEGPPPMPPASLSLDPVVHTTRANAATALAASPWAPLVAVAGQKQVLLYNSDTCDLLGVLPFPEGTIQVLKFSRNASLLLAAGGHPGKTGRVVVWSVTTGKRIVEVGEETDSVLAADISPDQTQIALGGPSKVIRIYGTKDSKLIHEIRKHTDWITSLEYSPDGVLLATGDRNGGLQVWESFTAREYFSLRGHTAAITEICWRADGNVLASTSEDTTVRLWEMENGGQIRTWGAHGGGSQSINFAKDGRLVSAGRDRTVKLWDGNGGAIRTFEAFPDVALRATVTHDGARVLGGDWTGQILVWQTADGKRVGALTPNPAPVAERLEAATKELIALQATHTTLTTTAATSQNQLQAATAELARLQKLAADSATLIKTATDNLAKAKAASDQAKAALALAQSEAHAKEVLTQALTEASNKVKAAAAAAKDDKALAAAALRANDLVTTITNELTLARKTLQEKQLASQTADAAVAPAQQALTAATANAATAPKMVETQTAALKVIQTKAAADQAALAPALASLNQAKATVDKLKAATSVVRQPGK
jgi:Planctomycete cytochrome C/WD domain, G-beta repeat